MKNMVILRYKEGNPIKLTVCDLDNFEAVWTKELQIAAEVSDEELDGILMWADRMIYLGEAYQEMIEDRSRDNTQNFVEVYEGLEVVDCRPLAVYRD